MAENTKYRDMINQLQASRTVWEKYANECEEYFYSDVEETHTQFTKKQLDRIKKDYDIPLSLNVVHAIMDQLVAFLIGNKPSARVLPVGEADKNTAYLLQELWNGLWYRSRGMSKLRDSIYHSVITGSGYLIVEPSNFYQPSIFDVNISHLPWRHVFRDPNGHEWDLSDCEYILVSKTISSDKVKNIYGKKPNDPKSWPQVGTPDDGYEQITSKPVALNDLYIKEYLEEGFIDRNGKYSRTPIPGGFHIKSGTYIKRVILSGVDDLLWEGYLPLSNYPIVHIPAVWRTSSKKGSQAYGIVHFIKDCQDAINKTVAHIILNAQLHGHAKMLLPKGMADPDEVNKWASDPGKVLEYNYDPNEPAIKPERIPPMPLANAHYTLFQELIKMVEYITGIYSVMQGNPTDAPTTFGGTQSLQVYGTQRIKMRAGIIDEALTKCCHVALSYIAFFSEPGKIYRYITDEVTSKTQDPTTGQMVEQVTKPNEEWRELKITGNIDITEYDIVTVPHPSTPTTRMLASMLLGNLAGQSPDPNVSSLLAQYSLKLMDIPEADDIIKQVDIMKNLQQQLQQLQQALEQTTKQVQNFQKENQKLTKQIIEKEYELEVQKKADEAKQEIELEMAHHEGKMEGVDEMIQPDMAELN